MCAISEKHPIWSAFWLKRSYGDISLQARPISFHIFPCCCCTVALIPPPCLRYAIAPIRVLNDPNIMNKIVYINIGFFFENWYYRNGTEIDGNIWRWRGPLAFFKHISGSFYISNDQNFQDQSKFCWTYYFWPPFCHCNHILKLL